MIITYNDTKKDLPVEQLHHLFFSVGWAGSDISPDPEILKKFNICFINSTLVISAWENERLIGTVRVFVNVNITLYKKWNIKMYSLQPNQSSIAPSSTYCFSLSR